ncbi:MAG TPA: hypothetical protein VG917_00370 [Patescibacteria group bacterium]|nr:hypothetical protein [Patescibacteria group bacterium]
MDIASVSQNSIKVKTKSATFIIDPSGKIDSDVVILTQKPEDYTQFEDKVVIDGPGEYEVSGVSIKGDKVANKLSFDFLEDNQRLLFAPVSAVKDIDTEGYTGIVMSLDEKVAGEIPSVAAELVAVIGPEEFLPQDKSTIKKIDKLNLKKVEENKGFVVHLSK